MESPQKNNSNTGIVVAVLCLIIGVVLGAVVVNTKTSAVSQQSAAIKSTPAQQAAYKESQSKFAALMSSKHAVFVDFSQAFQTQLGGTVTGKQYWVYSCYWNTGFFMSDVDMGGDVLGCQYLGTINI